MSVLLAVSQTALASPVPVPSPIVVHDTILKTITVAAHSPQFMRGMQLLLLFLAGLGGSWAHQLFEKLASRKGGFSAGVNIAIQFVFGLLVATVTAFVSGQLTLSIGSFEDFAASLLVVLGTSQGRYMFKKWTDSLGTDAPETNPTAGGEPEPTIPTKAAV